MKPEVREYMAALGRKGGKKAGLVTAEAMTPKERLARARAGGKASAAKRAALENARTAALAALEAAEAALAAGKTGAASAHVAKAIKALKGED